MLISFILIEIIIAILITLELFNIQIVFNIIIYLLIIFNFFGLYLIFIGADNCGCFGTVYSVKPVPTIIKNIILIAIVFFLKNNEK